MRPAFSFQVFLLAFALCLPLAAHALPLWELGMGVGSLVAPDYPGSDHTNFWLLPFPYGVYRGQIFHSDQDGARARLFRAAHYEINISSGGGLPSSSQSNTARQGMPDLEWMGEVGPRLVIDLWSHADSVVQLGIPVRLSFSTNWKHLSDRGLDIEPELTYDNPHLGHSDWDLFLHLGVEFIDRRLADYFYGVDPQYRTADRPAYSARGGYMETDWGAELMIPFHVPNMKIYAFASAQNLDGAANASSPLFRTHWNSSVGLVAIWMFATSKTDVSPRRN